MYCAFFGFISCLGLGFLHSTITAILRNYEWCNPFTDNLKCFPIIIFLRHTSDIFEETSFIIVLFLMLRFFWWKFSEFALSLLNRIHNDSGFRWLECVNEINQRRPLIIIILFQREGVGHSNEQCNNGCEFHFF